MKATPIFLLIALAAFTQGSLANTVWLKSGGGHLCKNSLSGNPDQVIGFGGADRSGAFTLTLDNPTGGTLSSRECAGIPRTVPGAPIVFNGSVAPQQVDVNFIKATVYPKTGQTVQECLRQGTNYSGISSGPINDTTNTYSLTLGFSYTDGCDPTTGAPLTPSGQPNFNRTLALTTLGTGATYNGRYHIFNVNAVPEPNALLLVLAGAMGMGLAAWMCARRPLKAVR